MRSVRGGMGGSAWENIKKRSSVGRDGKRGKVFGVGDVDILERVCIGIAIA